ncbi:hypothetical protein EDC96DRAFT_563955 [Choanephora cucurbitarum]|nr:hypothetical protein EDC96DRAFT_563955 [Choanephora cucurbitarum]
MIMRAEQSSKKTPLNYYNSEKMLLDHQQFPSLEAFDAVVNNYLQNLSSKKRDKALVDNHRYSLILQVLKDPRNTAISTAQFRFWVKKMFCLSKTPDHIEFVCHDNKPVATREDIYHILIAAHKEAHHGGRDKTSALVRKRYSWIPKELIARFVRHCPFCLSRRNGTQQQSTSSACSSKKRSDKITYQPYYPNASVSIAATVATSAAVAAVTSSLLAASPPLDNHLDFYYPHTTTVGATETTLINEQILSSPKPNRLFNRYLNHSADAAAAVVAAAAIAAATQQRNTSLSSSQNCFSQDSTVADLKSCILPTPTSCAFYSSNRNHSILLSPSSPDSCS